MKKYLQIDYDQCMACGLCYQACPFSCLIMEKADINANKKVYPKLNPDKCTGCSICKGICPMDAITMTGE